MLNASPAVLFPGCNLCTSRAPAHFGTLPFADTRAAVSGLHGVLLTTAWLHGIWLTLDHYHDTAYRFAPPVLASLFGFNCATFGHCSSHGPDDWFFMLHRAMPTWWLLCCVGRITAPASGLYPACECYYILISGSCVKHCKTILWCCSYVFVKPADLTVSPRAMHTSGVCQSAGHVATRACTVVMHQKGCCARLEARPLSMFSALCEPWYIAKRRVASSLPLCAMNHISLAY